MTESDTEEKQDAEEQPRESFFSLVAEVVRFSVIALLFIVPIRIFIAQPYIVSGASMQPTFESGEYLIVDQLSYRFEEPKRGDVVIFRFPQDPSKYFIKRIIGIPGETVAFKNGILSVISNGAEINFGEEPYVRQKYKDTFLIDVKENEYFVMGDNRSASLDSRIFGAVPQKYIVGRALVRLLPPLRLALFPGFYAYSEEVDSQ